MRPRVRPCARLGPASGLLPLGPPPLAPGFGPPSGSFACGLRLGSLPRPPGARGRPSLGLGPPPLGSLRRVGAAARPPAALPPPALPSARSGLALSPLALLRARPCGLGPSALRGSPSLALRASPLRGLPSLLPRGAASRLWLRLAPLARVASLLRAAAPPRFGAPAPVLAAERRLFFALCGPARAVSRPALGSGACPSGRRRQGSGRGPCGAP